MARDDWNERLEAYLDGELDPQAAASFEAETAADRRRLDALASRRAFREAARRALAGAPALDTDDFVRSLAEASPRGAASVVQAFHGPRVWRRAWPVLALAAVLTLVVLGPRMLRNVHEAAGPRFAITRAGQVAAVRFGEQPGETVTLEAGVFDQRTGEVH